MFTRSKQTDWPISEPAAEDHAFGSERSATPGRTLF